jgi:tight adherence protein C
MPLPLIIAASLLVMFSISLIIMGIASPRAADQVEARLIEYGGRPLTLEEIELAQPFSQRVLVPLIQASAAFLSRFTPGRTVEATRHKLDLAGNPFNWGAAEFIGVRGLVGVGLAILVMLLTSVADAPLGTRVLLTGVALALGFLLPGYWLGRRIKGRQEEVVKTLPDALDLLSVSVEAGLGLDAAMQRVADRWDNELSKAFARVLREMQMGVKRNEALRGMAERLEVPDMTSFVAALIQASQLGISIAKVLKIQADQMRIKRRQRAEEKAQQAPVKMLFPMTFLIFPSLWIVIMGPAALILKSSPIFGGGG